MPNAIEVASLFATLSLNNTMSRGLQTAGRDMNTFAGRMRGAARNISRFTNVAFVGIGIAAVNAAIEWEDAFAGVVKTVDASSEELDELEQQLRDMASGVTGSPVAALEDAHVTLAKIAELGGQLGIATEDIAKFSETIGMLAMSTDLTAENAATMLAQFANITGMDMSDIDRAGSTLVDLGNKMAATEGQILEMSMRLAGAGKQIGLSEPEIMGLAAALASLGLEPEAAGTAITQTLLRMGNAAAIGGPQLDVFAQTAGVTADAFADMVKNDPAQAFEEFIKGFSEQDLATQLATLDALGLSGIRTSDALRRLASDPALLARAFDIANTAWEENTALMSEAEKRASTTQGMLNTLGNSMKELLISAGEHFLPVVQDVVEGLTLITQGNFEAGARKLGEAFQSIANAVGSLVKGLADTALEGLEDILGLELPNVDETLAIWQGIVDDIGLIVEALPGIIQGHLEQIWIQAQPVVQPIIDFFTVTIPDAITEFVTSVEGIWGRVSAFFDELKAGITLALQPVVDVINEIITGINNLTGSSIPALRVELARGFDTSTVTSSGGFGGSGGAAPTSGARQTGGAIPRTGLYALHAGEDVLNRQEARMLRRNGMGGSPAYVYVYGENPYDLVAKIDRARRNRGR